MINYIGDNDIVLEFIAPNRKEYSLVITGIATGTVFKRVKKWYRKEPVIVEVGLDEVSLKDIEHIKNEYKKIKSAK